MGYWLILYIEFMIKKIFAIAAFTLVPMLSMAQKNVVDQIIWVVGNEPILLSDIEETRITAEASGMPIDNPYCTIPEQIAVNKLFVHQAELDSVTVSEGDIIRGVENRINETIQTFGSREAMEQMYGRTLSQIRDNLKKQYREQMMANEVRSKLTKDVKVTPAEVREYYKNVPTDSLPFIPTQVEVQIITSTPKVARAEVERIEAKLREYARRVNSGEADFSTLAKFYSEDGSARNGGELGYMGRSQLVPEFANVAFSLNDPKKVSKIVRSEYGYHIIQLIDKKGDKVNVRHILLKPHIEASEIEKDILRLDSIATDIRANKFTFDEAAQVLSDDKDTRNNHGLMANVNQQTGIVSLRFEMKDLPQDVAKVVDTLKVGEISKAFSMTNAKGQEVCAIVKLKDRIEGHRASMTEDFQTLREEVLNKRSDEAIEKWIQDKIKTTYVRIHPEWRNCNFHYKGWIK